MREIKFRAWDKENETMVYPKGILFDGRVVFFSCGALEPFEGYELMQYTGLKDKNGMEVYEGDIINICTEGGCNPAKVIFDNEDQKGCFCVIGYLGDLRTYPIKDFVDCEIEVIGNIYENPELLHREEMEN